MRRLERLGARSPLSNATRVDDGSKGSADDEKQPGLLAPSVDFEPHGSSSKRVFAKDALEIAAEAICSALAVRAGVKPPERPEDATVWLHTDVLPGVGTGVDASMATRLLAVTNSSNVPTSLARRAPEGC